MEYDVFVKLFAVLLVVGSFAYLGYLAWRSKKREHVFVIGENEKHEIVVKIDAAMPLMMNAVILGVQDVYIGVDGKEAYYDAIAEPWTNWSWTETIGNEEKHKILIKLVDPSSLKIELYVDDLLFKKEPVQK